MFSVEELLLTLIENVSRQWKEYFQGHLNCMCMCYIKEAKFVDCGMGSFIITAEATKIESSTVMDFQ